MLVGPQAWVPASLLSRRSLRSSPEPRVSVLATDVWRHSLVDGDLHPVPAVPMYRTWWRTLRDRMLRKAPVEDLLRGAHFTPALYLHHIRTLGTAYVLPKDILMYYGGIAPPNGQGLNFNGWSAADLQELRALDCRPFIGLETTDRTAILSLVKRLKAGGYGPKDRIYVRILSEPSGESYGTDTGTVGGRHHTRAAYAAYRRRFAQTAHYINALNRTYGLNIHNVFAGTNEADFLRYAPAEEDFDALGYDLYITPENKDKTLRLLKSISKRYPYKPLVIPEFGIATDRPALSTWRERRGPANPEWASDALGDVLEILGKHPAGTHQITLFSVNAAGRLSRRRWNWAWTPAMFEMIKEWKEKPRRWRKSGFHTYDPKTYAVGQNVLCVNRPNVRVVYRKLHAEKAPGVPLYQEYSFRRHGERWTHRTRTVYWEGTTIHEVPLRSPAL